MDETLVGERKVLEESLESQLRIPCGANENTYGEEHKHKCSQCATTWKHSDETMDLIQERFQVSEEGSEEERECKAAHKRAHTCPSCGAEEFHIHRVLGDTAYPKFMGIRLTDKPVLITECYL